MRTASGTDHLSPTVMWWPPWHISMAPSILCAHPFARSMRALSVTTVAITSRVFRLAGFRLHMECELCRLGTHRTTPLFGSRPLSQPGPRPNQRTGPSRPGSIPPSPCLRLALLLLLSPPTGSEGSITGGSARHTRGIPLPTPPLLPPQRVHRARVADSVMSQRPCPAPACRHMDVPSKLAGRYQVRMACRGGVCFCRGCRMRR
jgi:hypothetical protein